MPLFLGAISGTSADGQDIALVRINKKGKPYTVSGKTYRYTEHVKKMVEHMSYSADVSVKDIAELDFQVGKSFAEAIESFFMELDSSDIKRTEAIGFHGQTIFHGYTGKASGILTLQVGEASILAQKFNIPVVYDFRRADVAAGGQGAPLAPIIHYPLFASDNESRLIVNIGGIANITFIPKGSDFSGVVGFDTGPGNCISDALMKKYANLEYDSNGSMASRGKVNNKILESFLNYPFIKKKPPKAAGFEISFNLREDFMKAVEDECLCLEDALATSVYLTVLSVKQNIDFLGLKPDRIILCGGGSKNAFAKDVFADTFSDMIICTSDELGVGADFIEASLFAYLAYFYVSGIKLNLNKITGSRYPITLGKLVKP
jgi:anhydro-N-acetylmuramic acid kinase